MINDLDKVLRQLLIREMPIKNGEVNVEFDQPKREWSARLSQPTLNLFLHDLRENKTLRQHEWEVKRGGNGGYTRQRRPIRMDLHYLITAWAAQPADEHRLLTRALLALFRHPTLPEELLPESLQGQPVPIQMSVAQYDGQPNPADMWSALDNELRPAIVCMVTLALNPYQAFTGPLVQTRDLRVGQAATPVSEQRLDVQAGQDRSWLVGGQVSSDRPLEDLQVTLVERGLQVPLQAEGQFTIGNLEEGDYTLEVSAEGRQPSRHKLTVPSKRYVIEL